VNSPLRLCQYDNYGPLTAIGQNLKWYSSAAGGVAFLTPPVPYTGFEDSMVYYVSQTVNGCESDRALLKVYVSYRPNGVIVANKPFDCQFDEINFSYYGNSRPNAQYNWSVPSPAGVVTGGGGQGPLTVRFDSAGFYTVKLTVNNNGCLSQEARLQIEVRELPKVTVQSKDDICEDETVNIVMTKASPGIESYNWDFDGGNVVYGTYGGGPFGIRWSTPGTKIVTVRATRRECTSLPLRDTIRVHAYPDARILNASNRDVCAGDSVMLQARDLGPGYFYQWTPQVYFQNSGYAGTTAWATPLGIAALKLTVSDSFGCTRSDSVVLSVKPCCNVSLPTAFTPNNDGKNDVFRIISDGHQQISSFRVVNKWGQVMWETTNARSGWDGTFGGAPQDMGTYFYYLKYRCADGEQYEMKGEFILIR
jgi:gliding motility-associated-like protein